MWFRKGVQLVTRHRLHNRFPHLVRNTATFLHVRTLSGGPIRVSEEVRDAIHSKQPVVAFESTIITHGMPSPENIQTALSVEQIARDHGVTPATVGIIKGKLIVGLTEGELEFLSEQRSDAVKTSRRDLAYVLSQGLSGGTTVSGTMIAAHRAGIHIFVTGGIGGVHRGAELSMDVSADLTELGRTPVTVISAGVKSILDIGRTLEYLETEGVCVASYGSTKDFPAFFTSKSGFQTSHHVENPLSAAHMIKSSLDCELQSGLLIAVPIPQEYAADEEQINNAVKQAVFEAESQGVQGKEVTPFILSRVNEIMGGLSLHSNIALVKNNAAVGCQIACELSKLLQVGQDIRETTQSTRVATQNTTSPSEKPGRDDSMWNHCIPAKDPPKHNPGPGKVVVVGGVNVDLSVKFGVDSPSPNGGTYPGTIKQTFGGVGRNMADCLARMGKGPLFISAVGSDSYGDLFYRECSQLGLQPVKQVPGYTTSTYCAVLKEKGDLIYGVGDFDAHQKVTPKYVSSFERDLEMAPLVFLDGNIPAETIQYVCEVCHASNVPVWFDPADLRLIEKLFQSKAWRQLTVISPNLNELRVYNAKTVNKDARPSNIAKVTEQSLEETLEEGVELGRVACKHIPVVLLTLGKHGVLLCRSAPNDKPLLDTSCQHETFSAVHYPLPPDDNRTTDIVSVSGAGDCLSGAFLAGILNHLSEDVAIKQGLLAAQLSLRSTHAVPSTITAKNVSLDNVPNHQDQWKHRVVASC